MRGRIHWRLAGSLQDLPLWNNALLPALFLVSAMSVGAASVLLVGAARYADEFDGVGLLKKVHFCLPVIEIVLVASLLFVTSFNSAAGWNSVESLVSGKFALLFWIGFAGIGLVFPALAEARLLFFSSKELEESAGGHFASVLSEAGFLAGGFLLRYLVLVAALSITMVVPAV